MHKINIIGQSFNMLTVIEETDPYVSPKGKKRARYLCQCECGNTTKVDSSSLRTGATKSCGCHRKKVSANLNRKHGDKAHSSGHYYIYTTWRSLKSRCFEPNATSYDHYKSKGITMYKNWREDYQCFKEYILSNLGERPSVSHSIDRIDNDGNYEPGNIRWASKTLQNINKDKQSNNTSGVVGVSKRKNGKWQAAISVNKKRVYLGTFETIEEAAKARKEAEDKYFKPLLDVA